MNDVSVVMGTFNGGVHIRKQLISLVTQTLQPAEIVIGDDGSDDDTLQVIADVARTSTIPFRVHRNASQLGFSGNFLATAAKASGRFIAFCDQDDVWHPAKLERTRAAGLTHDAAVVTHSVRLIDAAGAVIGFDNQSIDTTRVLAPREGNPWAKYYGFTLLFDRRLLSLIPADLRGPDTFCPSMSLPHDRWICFLGSNFGRIITLRQPLADYRQHGANVFGYQRMSMTERLRRRIGDGSGHLAHLASVARARAALLRGFSSTDTDDFALAADRWTRIWTLCAARSRLASAVSPWSILSAARTAARCGSYRPKSQGGSGYRGLVGDVMFGVVNVIGKATSDRRQGRDNRPDEAPH